MPDRDGKEAPTLPRLSAYGLRPGNKIILYEDWTKMGEVNRKALLPQWATLAYDYTARVSLAAGVDAGYPKAAEALQWVMSHGHSDIFRAPAWSIVPRNAGESRRR